MKRILKIFSLLLALTIVIGTFAGCGDKTDNGKINITVAAWPNADSNAKKHEQYEGYKAKFLEQNPDIEFNTDEWRFDLKGYLVRAAGKDLPTVFTLAPTELDTLVNSGYIRDITPFMEKYGYLDKYDKKQSHIYMRDNKCYAVVDPGSVYGMGMVYNNKLFEEAGLVDENGLPIYPETWEEVTETAVKIKEKTGKAGYAINTMDRLGGWNFLNIAYSYGVDFVEQGEDGKWKATFNTPECAEALQWIKDMRWKYDVLQDELLTSNLGKYVASGDAAMGVECSTTLLRYPKNFGIAPDAISMSAMPAGPAEHASLSSADIWVFSAEATDEEVEAVFKWFNFIGLGTEITDEVKQVWDEDYKVAADDNRIVGVPPDSIWVDEELYNVRFDIMKKYANVDPARYEHYTKSEGVKFYFDPEKCAQQLYDVLDSAIQKVLTDKDADVKKVLEEAEKNFQSNYLDKAE